MKNVNKLTEGAILLALFAVILLITVYVPIIGSFLNFVLPLPFIIFSSKNNFKYIAAFLVASILISFITSSLTGTGLMLIYGITGTVIGCLLQKSKGRITILIASSLTFMAGLVIFYAASAVFFHFNLFHELSTAFNESIKMYEDMLKPIGNQDQIELVKKQSTNMLKMIQTLAPSILIMVSIVTVVVIQWICFPIAKRFGVVNVQPWGSFRNLVLPRSLLWYYLLALAANLLIHPSEGTYLSLVLANAIYLLEMFLLLQGLSFIFFIFYQKSLSKGLRVLVVILAFMIPIIHYIIMILGITDLGFDIRKRFEQKR